VTLASSFGDPAKEYLTVHNQTSEVIAIFHVGVGGTRVPGSRIRPGESATSSLNCTSNAAEIVWVAETIGGRLVSEMTNSTACADRDWTIQDV